MWCGCAVVLSAPKGGDWALGKATSPVRMPEHRLFCPSGRVSCWGRTSATASWARPNRPPCSAGAKTPPDEPGRTPRTARPRPGSASPGRQPFCPPPTERVLVSHVGLPLRQPASARLYRCTDGAVGRGCGPRIPCLIAPSSQYEVGEAHELWLNRSLLGSVFGRPGLCARVALHRPCAEVHDRGPRYECARAIESAVLRTAVHQHMGRSGGCRRSALLGSGPRAVAAGTGRTGRARRCWG